MAETKLHGARFSVFEVDLELHELRKHGIRIKLTGQPFRALALLLEHAGEIVTREQFRAALWPNEVWGEHDQRLNKVVNKIREALSDSAETPRFIETIPRLGYRFLVQVDRFDDRGAWPAQPVAASPSPAIAAAPPAQVELQPVFMRRQKPARFWLVLACISMSLLIAASLLGRFVPVGSENVRLAQPMPLTTYVGSELYPSLSPDGKQVVFAWDGESNTGFHIYIALASGGGAHQITRQPASDGAPAWSPNGKEIAFLRDSGPGATELWLIHADGQGGRKLRDIRSTLNSALTWTKNGRWLVVSQASASGGIPALFRVSATTGDEQQITFASADQPGGDLSPAISPDGKRLAFIRSTTPSWRDIFVVALSKDHLPAGTPVRLTDARQIIDHIAWTPNGSSILFSASTTTAGSRHLFRVDASSRTPTQVTELGIEGEHPTTAGSPGKLVFARKNIEQSSVWRLALARAAEPPTRARMFSSTRRDFTADLSPDGDHIVFSSVRSGPTEIWISKKDGSELRRLTSTGGSAPRWSPDGKRVAFEGNPAGQPDIYVLDVASGAIKRLTSEGAPNRRPSWSRDGRFIYFASNRTGSSHIWKLSSGGGVPVQITGHGALYAVETFDGKSIYYISTDSPAQLWKTSVNGGEETQVLPQIVGYSAIAMARDGVFYMSKRTSSDAELALYRFNDHTSRTLASIDFPVHPVLSGSPDGRSVLYSQVDRQDTDLMVLDPYLNK